MAAISIQINRGLEGFRLSDFTPGTNAPAAGDVELRFNTTDANSVTLTRLDVLKALDAFKRAIESDAFVITPLGI